MEHRMSRDDFVAKINWEGGITGALDYGLTTGGYDLPQEMAAGWDRLVDLYWDFAEAAEEWLDEHGLDSEDLGA